jgi:hypothetical protein
VLKAREHKGERSINYGTEKAAKERAKENGNLEKGRENGLAKHMAVTAIQAVVRMRMSGASIQRRRNPTKEHSIDPTKERVQVQKLVCARVGSKIMLSQAAKVAKSYLAVRGTVQGKSGWYENLESVKLDEVGLDPGALAGAPEGTSQEVEVSHFYELKIDEESEEVRVLQGPLKLEEYKVRTQSPIVPTILTLLCRR